MEAGRPRLRLCINLSHVQDWFAGDFRGAIDIACLADEIGIDQITIADHLVMSDAGIADYPYGRYYQPVDYPWPEPIAYLGALAAVTRRIDLSTGILIAPLRPAVLLAKQLATLDQLSGGRIVAGLGVGWQRSEYDAAGVPWDNRFGRIEETILAMRALWGRGPVSFAGKSTTFADVHAEPSPYGGRAIPIWLGLGLGPRNLDRIVTLADGWLPVSTEVSEIIRDCAIVRAACSAHGRDPDTMIVRAMPASGTMAAADGSLTALAADCLQLRAAGVGVIQVYPHRLAGSAAEAAALFRRLVEMRDAINAGLP